MLFECVCKTLGQVLLNFPPTIDDEVDALMDTKIRVKVFFILRLLSILSRRNYFIYTYVTYLTSMCILILVYLLCLDYFFLLLLAG